MASLRIGITVWKLALGELGQRRRGVLVAQQGLGRQDDQRLAQNWRTICRRSTWKIWLAVVGCTICMLLSAPAA
jgi:hypothetical protein